MTDQQILTIAIAIVFPLSMLLYSNSRVSDAKETLRAEMALGFERTLNAMKGMERKLEDAIKALEHKLELHELEHHK